MKELPKSTLLTEQEKLLIQLLSATFDPHQIENITQEGAPPLTVEQFVAVYMRSQTTAERNKLYSSAQTERFITQGVDCLLNTAGIAEHSRLENVLATTAFVQTEQIFQQLAVPMKTMIKKLQDSGEL